MPSELAKDYFNFDECVLDSFDDEGVRRRFGRVTGVAVTKALRPVIERQLAEQSGSPPGRDAWKSGQMDERTAQLFILCVNEFVWMPLMTFVSEAEQALGKPGRLAQLRRDFEAAVKRDGFWHKGIDDLTSWAAAGRSGGHA
jgi:hypothetical protein